MDGDVIDWLAERAAEPYELGVSDCVTLCRDYILRSGVEPGEMDYGERALMSSDDIRREIIAGIERRPMFREVDPLSVDGDALGLTLEEGCGLALHHKRGWWIVRVKDGLRFVRKVERAWLWDTG